MIHVDIHRTIDQPIEKVFDRLADIPAYPNWLSTKGLFLSAKQHSGGELKEGTEYSEKTRLGPLEGDVWELDRPKKLVYHYQAKAFGKPMIEGWPGYQLEAEGDRTHVHHFGVARLFGPWKVLQPFFGLIAKAERRRTVAALKRSFES